MFSVKNMPKKYQFYINLELNEMKSLNNTYHLF